jgi:hypothetical protein
MDGALTRATIAEETNAQLFKAPKKSQSNRVMADDTITDLIDNAFLQRIVHASLP